MRTIKYNVGYEKLISRIPALFPFVEFDENGNPSIVKATEGVQGDYGKMVADIACPSFNYTCTDGTELKINGGLTSYRTIIDTYYKAIKDKEWDRDTNNKYVNPFLAFVEKAIGLIYTGLSEEDGDKVECGVKLKKHFPLAPDYIYLGEAKTIYNKVVKLLKQICFWEGHTTLCKEDRVLYTSLKNEYEMMNGDKLIETLENLITMADEVAQEYYDKAHDYPKLKFNVNLVNTIKDLGMVTPYIQEWEAGKRYYDGDVVYYVDEYGYGMTWECKIASLSGIKEDDFKRKYINGDYDEESELILFEDGKQTKVNGTKVPQYWFPQSLNWVTEKPYLYNKGENSIKIEGKCNSHLISLRKYEEYMNREDQVEIPENFKDWLWYYRVGTIVNRDESYDYFGNIAVMYKNGDIIQGIQAIDGGNNPSNLVKNGNEVVNLAVWGDIITDITAKNDDSSEKGEITFVYWLGAHMKADYDGYSVDDDGNYKYFFKNFKIDTESVYGKKHGVKYTETYIYYKSDEDDSIWKLVENKEFDNYVRGKYDKDSKDVKNEDDFKLREKFEFDTSNNVYLYDVKIGNNFKNVPYIRTNFETEVDITHVDVEKTPLIRYDYYSGVNYQPTVNKDVNIERGVTQAFEKHIKFSEIKTFEDLENYANGGFFSISKENIDLG